MIALRLIEDARAHGVTLEVDGADLIVEADDDPPAELIAELRQYKAELIAALVDPVAADTDDLAERAALIEYGAGVPRAWAEGYARFDPDRPPGDVPPQRWLRFVDDVGHFLDGGFAEQAAALGWGPLDLFGADDVRPFARVDRAGLLWLLHGDRLVALTVDAAIIETPTGARQTYRRKPNEPGRVLAWDLVPGR